jgi:hypothetical protein
MNTNIPERFLNKFEKEIGNPLVIDLGGKKVVKEIPARNIEVSKIEIMSIEDSAVTKKVVAKVKGFPGQIVLWEGEAYDAIGQWTDTDVANRIKEIYK